jgi:hypothetical protein
VGALTAEQARAYLERWELVRAVEAAELQRTPMQTKLLQLAALMHSRGLSVLILIGGGGRA